MDHFFNLVRGVGIRDILDILIVAVVFYRLFLMLKETRGEQLMKGIIILFLFAKITGSDFVRFYTINWLLEELLNLGAIAIIIVFQPELRRALENLGDPMSGNRASDRRERPRRSAMSMKSCAHA